MGTAIEKYKKQLAVKAKEYAAEEKITSQRVSVRGGIMKIGEDELPGNQMLAIIVDYVYENAYYDHAYDPDVQLPPKCFALAFSEKDLAADEACKFPEEADDGDYFIAQSDGDDAECSKCEFSKWGSADKGRGKKCGNRRRLAVMFAGEFIKQGKRDYSEELYVDADHYRDAPIFQLSLSPTNMKAFSKYASSLTKQDQLPPFAVVSNIIVEPDAENQFTIDFELVEKIGEGDLSDECLGVILSRVDEAREMLLKGYEAPSEDELAAPKVKGKNSIAARKKARR